MAAAAAFESPFLFKRDDVTVVIRHSQEKNLRCKPGSLEEVDADGGFGGFAQWVTKVRNNDGVVECQFKSSKSGKYLRIHSDKVDVGGAGGPFTWFRVHFQNVACVKLESVKFEGQYIAVDKNGVRVGKGGPWCRLHIRKEGAAPTFAKPYHFLRQKVVVIEHRDRKYVRRMDDGSINTEGGTGKLAQWEVTPEDGGKQCRIKHVKSGEWLRISRSDNVDFAPKAGPWTLFNVHPVDAPHQVRLESHHFKDKFVALNGPKNTLQVGAGKHKRCFFTFYRDD